MMGRDWTTALSADDGGRDEPDDDPRDAAPTAITVTVFRPVEFTEVGTGAVTTVVAPTGRSFPLFMTKAAFRYRDYLRRRHGEKNVFVDYE